MKKQPPQPITDSILYKQMKLLSALGLNDDQISSVIDLTCAYAIEKIRDLSSDIRNSIKHL